MGAREVYISYNVAMSEDTALALSLLNSASAVAHARQFATGGLEPYAESVDHAVASLLEFFSAVVGGLASENDPYQEVGTEPTSQLHAASAVPSFLDQCREILSGPPPYPFMCISTRAQTFACILLDKAG